MWDEFIVKYQTLKILLLIEIIESITVIVQVLVHVSPLPYYERIAGLVDHSILVKRGIDLTTIEIRCYYFM